MLGNNVIARRRLIAGVGVSCLAVVARGQTRVRRIGLLSTGTDPDKPNPVWIAFLRGLSDLGYVEGRDLAIERDFAGGNQDLLSKLVGDLTAQQVDLVVVTGELEAAAVKAALPTTPVVMMLVQEPVGAGLVASLARPGGFLTGLTTQAPELYAKRVQLLQEAVPRLKRVGLLLNDTGRDIELTGHEADEAAVKLGVQLVHLPFHSADELDGAFTRARRERLDAVVVVTGGVSFNQRGRIAHLAISAQLPLMSEVRYFADAGALMAYGPSYTDLARRAAGYVDRILRGAKPADLPVEQPTKFELVVNLKTAKTLGLIFPQTLLVRADEVIE